VVAGPFASRDAAEKAAKQLRSLGLDQGKVVQKAG
jgi:cell division septation protein DedD